MSTSHRTKTLCTLAVGLVLLLIQAVNADSYAICSTQGVVAYIGDDKLIYPPGTTSPTGSGLAQCGPNGLVISAPPNFPLGNGQNLRCSDASGNFVHIFHLPFYVEFMSSTYLYTASYNTNGLSPTVLAHLYATHKFLREDRRRRLAWFAWMRKMFAFRIA
ncbi:uncharacterized protein MELLADRAFT_105220 [Melampsora larici-populina 98AG31]|uniref:Secreted protein n=1 Tax=Melampsora larici-populina (strain 98AG31 / pathotype 3-4-7) TaxID=747676 RepID=F4RH36_MELLP|nr:uncharacterized protein MELLADRAFT_105220 [Melampsora larici-populina 98AG31]EGG08299.1 hypothetical protein MELLADRAFT_105220 [Melampsora larici-populina 98AG31]